MSFARRAATVAAASLGLTFCAGIAAPSSQAARECTSPKLNGPSSTVRCYAGSWTSYQFAIICVDGISGYRYRINGPWVAKGATTTLTCGAPQRQYVDATAASFQ